MKLMLALVKPANSAGSVTLAVPPLTLPMLPASNPTVIGAAAAIWPGSVNASWILAAAAAVGCRRKRSPAAAAPDSTSSTPSTTNGSAPVPVPVIATAWPVSARAAFHAAPSKRRTRLLPVSAPTSATLVAKLAVDAAALPLCG